jgi:hypothetical protein
MTRKKVVADLREDCDCAKCEYCPLEAVILSMETEIFDRFLEQHKCIEIFKYNKGKQGNELTWNESYLSWANEGYAKLFADHYNEERSAKQIYKLIEKDMEKK